MCPPPSPTALFVADAHFHLQPDPAEQERVQRFLEVLEKLWRKVMFHSHGAKRIARSDRQFTAVAQSMLGSETGYDLWIWTWHELDGSPSPQRIGPHWDFEAISAPEGG